MKTQKHQGSGQTHVTESPFLIVIISLLFVLNDITIEEIQSIFKITGAASCIENLIDKRWTILSFFLKA